MAIDVQDFARNLALGLLSQQWQPQHLSPSKARDAEQLTQQCLLEAIALREAGQAGLSMEVLSAAEQAGLQSPWLLDNQARALVALGQRQAALALWQRLLPHSDAALARTAQEMVTLQEQGLLEPLEELCRRAGWRPQHIHRDDGTPLLQRVLEELIASREAGAAELSLQMARESQRLDWTDPWLRDNEARALVHLGREAEAVAIWRDLRQHSDGELVAAAEDMLALYEAAVELDQQAEQLAGLQREGRRDEAEVLLVQLLLRSPGDRRLLLQLGEVLEDSPAPSTNLLSSELRDDQLILAALRRLAAAVGAPQAT